MYKTLTIGLDNLYVVIKVEHLKFLYDKLKNEFSFVRDRMTKYYNIKRIKRLFFKEKDKIYLFRKNITIKRLSDKLNFKKFGPFIIIRKIFEFNYKLLLFKTIQIYFIFYVFLLEFISKLIEV